MLVGWRLITGLSPCKRWDHIYSLAAPTVMALLKHHGASLLDRGFGRHTQIFNRSDIELLKINEGLNSLRIASLDTSIALWPVLVLIRNHTTLRELRVGTESDIAVEYANTGRMDPSGEIRNTETHGLVQAFKESFTASDELPSLVLSLGSLCVCGFDFNVLINSPDGLIFNFINLRTLKLESCSGLMEALPGLASTEALGLLSFVLRHENATDAFMQVLENFLASLKPFTDLHVLLVGEIRWAKLIKLLKVHGNSL